MFGRIGFKHGDDCKKYRKLYEQAKAEITTLQAQLTTALAFSNDFSGKLKYSLDANGNVIVSPEWLAWVKKQLAGK